MTAIASSLLAGAGVGLSIAAPFGPASMFCVQRTLATGVYAGLATGIGIATVHLIYGTLAVFGGRLAFANATAAPAIFSFLSALFLLWFSIRILRRVLVISDMTAERRNLASIYCGALGFGFLNPLTPALFAAAIQALPSVNHFPPALLIAGVFLGSIGWWFFLTTGVSLLRERLDLRLLNLANKGAGLFLGALSIAMLLRSYHALI